MLYLSRNVIRSFAVIIAIFFVSSCGVGGRLSIGSETSGTTTTTAGGDHTTSALTNQTDLLQNLDSLYSLLDLSSSDSAFSSISSSISASMSDDKTLSDVSKTESSGSSLQTAIIIQAFKYNLYKFSKWARLGLSMLKNQIGGDGPITFDSDGVPQGSGDGSARMDDDVSLTVRAKVDSYAENYYEAMLDVGVSFEDDGDSFSIPLSHLLIRPSDGSNSTLLYYSQWFLGGDDAPLIKELFSFSSDLDPEKTQLYAWFGNEDVVGMLYSRNGDDGWLTDVYMNIDSDGSPLRMSFHIVSHSSYTDMFGEVADVAGVTIAVKMSSGINESSISESSSKPSYSGSFYSGSDLASLGDAVAGSAYFTPMISLENEGLNLDELDPSDDEKSSQFLSLKSALFGDGFHSLWNYSPSEGGAVLSSTSVETNIDSLRDEMNDEIWKPLHWPFGDWVEEDSSDDSTEEDSSDDSTDSDYGTCHGDEVDSCFNLDNESECNNSYFQEDGEYYHNCYWSSDDTKCYYYGSEGDGTCTLQVE